ncbi:MAG TPA: dipeptidase PepE [Pyrinomonadaceae bacterium]|nr:dipeptidase PepE [Pyrinomonadaceae bacterium]
MTTSVNNQRILLISNSTVYGNGFLDHAEKEITNFLGKVRRVLFIPFALHDHDAYSEKVRTRFNAMGYELVSLHEASDKPQAVKDAAAIFIGGGNTFRLLKALYEFDILDVIREKVKAGMPYIGSSAGANVAAPTIKTTNDMPIVEPPSFEALNLVSFQINPHYLDPDPDSKHMGETREERIVQFLEENDTAVVGLREGAMIRVEGGAAILKGLPGARIFQKGREPIEVKSGTRLSDYLRNAFK